MTGAAAKTDAALRATLKTVVALNLAYFCIEIVAGLAIGSVSLFADSVDFLEDASISLLVLYGLAWSPRARARLGMGLAGIIVVPSLAALAMAWQRYASGVAPEPFILGATGAGALCVNALCAWLLARHRQGRGSLMKAAFLSARNDAFANVAIIAAGFATAATLSPWPDLVVGLGIAVLNGGVAWDVWEAARRERTDPGPGYRSDHPE